MNTFVKNTARHITQAILFGCFLHFQRVLKWDAFERYFLAFALITNLISDTDLSI